MTHLCLILSGRVEITDEAVRVLDAAADIHGFEVATESFDWSCDRYLETGAMMPDNALETLGEFDSIFLGCIGDADKVEDHISLAMLLTIRKGFDQYVNLRPIKLYPGVSSPIATASPETVDILVIRENTESLYAGLDRLVALGCRTGVADNIQGRINAVGKGDAVVVEGKHPSFVDNR